MCFRCTVCLESFRLLSELKNHYPIHYNKDNPEERAAFEGAQAAYEKTHAEFEKSAKAFDKVQSDSSSSLGMSEDSKTLISFDKHLDKTVISQIVLTGDSLDNNYQNVETKNEPKDALSEGLRSPDVQIYVIDTPFPNTSLTKNM